MTFEEVRSVFPAALRVSYLNAAAASPLSKPVHAAITQHYDEALAQGDVGFMAWLRRKEEARASLAQLCGTTPDEVAFTQSTSMSFHLVGRMLQERGVREVVTLEDEFPSTTLPLLHLGFRLRIVRRRPDGSYAAEDVERAITRRTGAIAVSAVQFASGYRMDLQAVSRLCRARKLFFVVNVMQALGQLPVDMKKLRADFLCGASHKWLMGGYGVGFLAVRRALLKGGLPLAGWLSVAQPMAMDNLHGARKLGPAGAPVFTAEGARFRNDASALEPGGMAWGPVFGLEAALKMIHALGVAQIEAHNLSLQRGLRERLAAKGFVPNAPLGSGICVFPIEGAPLEVARALYARGVMVSARGVGLRVATHAFNDESDVDKLLWAMEQVGVKPGPRPKPEPRRTRRG